MVERELIERRSFGGLQDAATAFTQQLEEIKARYAARTEILASLDEVRFVRYMLYTPKSRMTAAT